MTRSRNRKIPSGVPAAGKTNVPTTKQGTHPASTTVDNPHVRRLSARSMTLAALMVTLAFIFSYVEALIPPPVALPGVKLGIANLVIVLVLYDLGSHYALGINILRVIAAGLLFSGTFGILYSTGGALFSMGVMVLLKKTGLFSIVGVSMAGGVFHNIGQLLVASLIVSNLRLFLYLPVLVFSGIATGIAIGFAAHAIRRALQPVMKRIG